MRKSVSSSYGRRASSMERSSLSGSHGSHSRRASSQDRSSMSGGPLRVNTDSNRKSGIPQQKWSSQYSQGSSNSGAHRNAVSRYSFYGSNQQQKKRMSRGSGMGMRGHTGITKDPRPISNKSYQQSCIKDLVMFLTERQFPQSISPKVLQSPTGGDFMKIFEFIYGFLNPKCSVSRDDVPKIFKQLGYPFTITKSSMHSVGSPHTWPTLLAGLNWLVNLIRWGLSGEIESSYFPSVDDDFENSVPETKIMYYYFEQTYSAYMAGQDSFEDYDEQLEKKMYERCCGTAGGNDSLEMEHKRLRAELELLENDMEGQKTTKEARDILKLDDERYMDHLSQIDIHRQGLEKQCAEAEEELNEAMADAKCAESNKQKMNALFEDQKLSQADVERIKLNGRELQRQRQEAERRESETDKEIWEKEMELSKEHEKLEEHCNEYNKLAQKLKLIPLSAENAYGVDYELKPSYLGYMDSRFTDTIKPALLQLKKQCSASVHTKSTEMMQVQESLEQVHEYVNEMKDDINMLESRSKRMGDELECKKQVFQREFQQAQEEMESLQRELMELQTFSQISLQDANRDLKNAYKAFEQSKMEIAETEKAYRRFMNDTTNIVTTHLEKIQGRFADLYQESEQVLVQVRREAQENQALLKEFEPPS
ncbi:kinetochore protein NDC80 homolog [Pecten maximus]|uniref:kinetochore protein NDC80 homolog n=1 Tax=Pecten maximus TaxID=6579 RepID=UPI001458175B|nr:kinetochore protein NDC80 homolog [Pecten maximus]